MKSDPNRESDSGTQEGRTEVTLPEGVSEDAFFETLVKLDSNYADDLDYDVYPATEGNRKLLWPDDGYNSNSYVSGLLGAAGATPPKIPGTYKPGYGKPVPKKHFSKQKSP